METAMSRRFGRIAAPQTPSPAFVAATRTVAVYATVTHAQGRLMPDTTTASGRR